jgi:hypothetical protein
LIYEPHAARLCQGGIFRDIEVFDGVEEVAGESADGETQLNVVSSVLPYAVMLSQDCDLEWDHRTRQPGVAVSHDKYLSVMLVCPAYPAAQLRAGTHLEGLKMQPLNSATWKLVTQNKNDRYHYLCEGPEFGIPELALDFKHYRTVPRQTLIDCLDNGSALGTLRPLYREHLSQRFANYLSRIGLPEPVAAEP